MPEGPDHGLKADITVVADVVFQKYAEHKPLFRQQQAFERVGIPLSRQTLCDWTGWCSDQVVPVVRLVREYILRQGCAPRPGCDQADDADLAPAALNRGKQWCRLMLEVIRAMGSNL
ncbi:MAG: transposase [Verrucomicrobia bacterium]|nr:transposase [Verrucomicrobiota bacterium]